MRKISKRFISVFLCVLSLGGTTAFAHNADTTVVYEKYVTSNYDSNGYPPGFVNWAIHEGKYGWEEHFNPYHSESNNIVYFFHENFLSVYNPDTGRMGAVYLIDDFDEGASRWREASFQGVHFRSCQDFCVNTKISPKHILAHHIDLTEHKRPVGNRHGPLFRDVQHPKEKRI